MSLRFSITRSNTSSLSSSHRSASFQAGRCVFGIAESHLWRRTTSATVISPSQFTSPFCNCSLTVILMLLVLLLESKSVAVAVPVPIPLIELSVLMAMITSEDETLETLFSPFSFPLNNMLASFVSSILAVLVELLSE